MDILVNQISVVEHLPGTAIAKVHSTFGVFSPAKQTYDILFPLNSSVAEMVGLGPMMPGGPDRRAAIIEDGLQPKITGMGIDMWSMRTLQSDRYTKLSPVVSGTITFTETGASISLHNKSKDELTDAVAIAGRRFWYIGKVPASRVLNVDQDTADEADPMGEPLGYRIYKPWGGRGEQQDSLVLAETANSVFGYQGEKLPSSPVLVAWLKKPFEAVEILGESPRIMGRTVLIVPLKVEAGAHMVLPVGTLSRRLVSTEGTFEPGPDVLTLSNGSAIFEFSIPEMDRAYKVSRLTLHFNNNNSPEMHKSPEMPVSAMPDNSCTIAIYDWKSSTWHKLDNPSSPLKIDNAENFISRDGNIQARVSTFLQHVNINVFDFEVVGKWQ
ncbi:MAG: hypothetical protein IBX64_09715 [Actinobacteria bacterium]|nr:hypothetical protein [Actinomycetota bacterium]